MSLEDYSDYLIDNVGVNEEVINCMTAVDGYNKNTLNNILYYYTGYRDLEQYTSSEDKETYQEYFKEEE